jgi:hypothetical protein
MNMYAIKVEKECGCFKKSDYSQHMGFANKDDALSQAILMENHMNREFCQKHEFKAVEVDERLIMIRVSERSKSQGGCCGGGHCS